MRIPFPSACLPGALAILLAASLCAKDEFESIDDKIVQAYNAEPKRTAEVYALCLELFDLGNGKKDSRTEAWIDKARKLLSIACLNEALEAQKTGDFKQVYIWCARASANGASKGEMGGLDLAEVSSLLSNLQADAKRAMDDSGESYANLSLDFRPPSRTDARLLQNDRPASSDSTTKQKVSTASSASASGPVVDVRDAGLQKDTVHTQGHLQSGAGGDISILEGPRQDRERNLFIKIRTPAGHDIEIIFRKEKGWTDKSLPVPIYYESWMKCAEDIIRNESK